MALAEDHLVSQGIHDAANANAVAVAAYGVTATDITDLQAAIDLYRLATQNPRQAIITCSQAKSQAKQMIKEVIADLLVGQMDVIVDTLKLSNRPHWDGYKHVREVIDLGSTTAKVRGTVVNDDNDSPLANVLFVVLEVGTENVVKQALSDGEGKFNVAGIAPGTYDFRWSLDGFMTEFEGNVVVAAGKELKRKVSLNEGGGSITIEGDVAPGTIGNVQVMGLEVVPETTIRVTVTGSTLRFYAATPQFPSHVGRSKHCSLP